MYDRRAFLVMCIVVLLLVAFAVVRLREGTTGQTLRALRGSQVGAQSIGISPARARIVAFTVSAFIAGLGGGMLAMLQQDVNYPSNFSPVPAALRSESTSIPLRSSLLSGWARWLAFGTILRSRNACLPPPAASGSTPS